jgi:hypothetical protein
MKQLNAEITEGQKKVTEEMHRVEIQIEQTTLDVLKHFMRNRNKIQKAIDDDPHSVDKGNPVAVARALGIKADKT